MCTHHQCQLCFVSTDTDAHGIRDEHTYARVATAAAFVMCTIAYTQTTKKRQYYVLFSRCECAHTVKSVKSIARTIGIISHVVHTHCNTHKCAIKTNGTVHNDVCVRVRLSQWRMELCGGKSICAQMKRSDCLLVCVHMVSVCKTNSKRANVDVGKKKENDSAKRVNISQSFHAMYIHVAIVCATGTTTRSFLSIPCMCTCCAGGACSAFVCFCYFHSVSMLSSAAIQFDAISFSFIFCFSLFDDNTTKS